VERHGVGRLQTLDRVLTIDPALGAGAYLAPKDAQKSFDSHVGNSSTSIHRKRPRHCWSRCTACLGFLSLIHVLRPAMGVLPLCERKSTIPRRMEVVIGLLPARPDTRYWHRDIVGSASVFFLQGRLRFGNTKQITPLPSCLVVWGGSDDLLTKLQNVLPAAWLSR
jgi:hypothetical protein